MTDTAPPSHDYESQKHQAEDDGTALPERTDDLPPADLWHTGQDLAALIPDLPARADEIGVPADANHWERLDVARAAAHVRETNPDGFQGLLSRHPWLADFADETGVGALDSLAAQF